LTEIAGEFGGVDPLKPVLRAELDETKERLVRVQERLRMLLHMDVVLREPLEEEVEEMRSWVKTRAAL
jgi:hypothetical protein